jgi:hypothetical protein
MVDRTSNVAKILRSDGQPWLKVDGTQAYSDVPDPPPAAFIGWLTMQENQDKPTSTLSVYVKHPGDPLTYRHAHLPGATVRVGGSPECSSCHRTGKQVSRLYVPSLAEAGKLSPEDERLCEDCYCRHLEKGKGRS